MRFLTAIAISLTLGGAHCFQPGASLIYKRSSIAKIPSTSSGGAQQKPVSNSSPLVQNPLFFTAAEASAPEEPWIKPRLHNNPLVRSAAILAALAIAGLSSPFSKLPSTAMASLHLLSFATWFGTVFYTTFIAGLTMFKALPRQTFGKLQSKLFPKYFSLCSLTIVLQLLTLSRLPGIAAGSVRVLALALVMTLLNQFLLEPTSTKIMFDRYELENSDDPNAMESSEYKKLKSKFGKLHGMSSLSNLIALIGAAVHGVHLSSALVVAGLAI